nr:putative ribonuclease H-like domain-containing protein [Tanacetum cinerariifolium]
MKCPEDIKTYAKIRYDQKLFQFLNGLDRKFKPITREILWVDPLPTAEASYATVRKKAAHQNILGATNNEPQGIATGLITKETEGVGFVTKGYRRNDDKKKWVTRDDKLTLNVKNVACRGTQKNILMHPTFCLLQDIRTGRIIGRGTERDGLNYVDEVTTSGTVMLAHGTSERKAWLCVTEDTIPNLISEVSKSQPSDSLDEILENIHETVGVQEHEEPTLTEVEEPTLTEVPEKYVLPASLYSEEAPSNVEQALKSEKWKNAMDVEMDALMRNGTWDKCILPQGKKLVGCRWIFTIKYKLDANQGWPLHQFDMKHAFLHRELKEEVYMEAPPGFFKHFKHEEVHKLKKSPYGLKQSPRAWFGRGDRVTCLIIYVDDMIITGNDENEIKKLKEGLCAEFEMKDLGNLRSHACSFKNCQIYKGNHQSWSVVQKNGHLNIQIFTDADWAGDKGNRRLTSGYFSLVGGNLVTRKSKKQKVVSLSSAEAGFRGIAKGLAEALWIRKLMSEIRFPPKESIRIMSDNKAAIQILENPVQHDKTKHVEVDRHFIKEKLEAGIIK